MDRWILHGGWQSHRTASAGSLGTCWLGISETARLMRSTSRTTISQGSFWGRTESRSLSAIFGHSPLAMAALEAIPTAFSSPRASRTRPKACSAALPRTRRQTIPCSADLVRGAAEAASPLALSPKQFIEVVQDGGAALQAPLVLLVGGCDALDDAGDTARFHARELRVLEVDVMDDFADRGERRVRQTRTGGQYLERAVVALMGELALIHVEAEFPRRRDVALGGNEFEFGICVDETTDQPG